MTEALKAQTQRVEELAERQRRLVALRAEAAAQPAPNPPNDARDRRVGPIAETGRADGRRVEVESPSSFGEEHGGEQFETSSRTAHVGGASLRDRAEFGGTGVRETALVPVVPRSRSVLMSDLIEEADKKRFRVTEVGGAPPAR